MNMSFFKLVQIKKKWSHSNAGTRSIPTRIYADFYSKFYFYMLISYNSYYKKIYYETENVLIRPHGINDALCVHFWAIRRTFVFLMMHATCDRGASKPVRIGSVFLQNSNEGVQKNRKNRSVWENKKIHAVFLDARRAAFFPSRKMHSFEPQEAQRDARTCFARFGETLFFFYFFFIKKLKMKNKKKLFYF